MNKTTARAQARRSVEEEIYLLRELAVARRAAAFHSFQARTVKPAAVDKRMGVHERAQAAQQGISGDEQGMGRLRSAVAI